MIRALRANQGADDGFAGFLRECFNPGTQAIVMHRFGAWTRTFHLPILRHVLAATHFVLESFISWRVGIYIPVRAEVGPGMVIHTWSGGIVMPACKIGRHLKIIGGGIQFDYDTQSIGEDCWIGAGTKFVGKIRIGDRVRTAPNTVVQTDVPDDSLVFGNPARIISRKRWRFAPTGSPQRPQRPADAAADAIAPPHGDRIADPIADPVPPR